ncbi:uncharacterized protein LOC134262262 [Saccostrea cucullata]|uniref:uncharacterized protein LOC134262262 n=1 Tax=Saccostrea cuccullata TaxID=36930 RepID=UPI002ED55AB1
MDVWSTPAVKEHCLEKLDLIQQTQVETNNKLSRLLELFENPPQEVSGLSDYLRQMTTPCPTSRCPPSVIRTDRSASETQKPKRKPLSAIELFEKENCQPCEGPPTPDDLFSDRPVEEDGDVQRDEENTESEEDKENEENRVEEVPLSVGISRTDVVSAFSSVNNTILPNCPSNATIHNVSSPKDIVPGNCKFVVNKELQQTARNSACSAGNFLWTMTKILFNEEELSRNMNFSGRKGKEKMSPRMRHSLVQLYVENYDRWTDEGNKLGKQWVAAEEEEVKKSSASLDYNTSVWCSTLK